jgi:hypothetical protein
MKLLFNKKSKEEEFQEAEERFLNIISSKEYGDMISKQMLEVKQRAKKRNLKILKIRLIKHPSKYSKIILII